MRFVPYSRQHLLLDFVLLLLELAHSLLSSSFCSHTFLMWIAPSCYEGLSKFCMFLLFSPFLQSLDDSLYHRNGQMISQFCLNHSHDAEKPFNCCIQNWQTNQRLDDMCQQGKETLAVPSLWAVTVVQNFNIEVAWVASKIVWWSRCHSDSTMLMLIPSLCNVFFHHPMFELHQLIEYRNFAQGEYCREIYF